MKHLKRIGVGLAFLAVAFAISGVLAGIVLAIVNWPGVALPLLILGFAWAIGGLANREDA